MKKRIYVLNGHPGETSLSQLFCETYSLAAEKAGHETRISHLYDLSFDADFGEGSYKSLKPQEDDLKTVSDNLLWSEHIVLVTPMWWGAVPAKLKGLFDRVLLPGFAFDTRSKTATGMPKPLLSGRTARLILTSDTPDWFFWLVYGRAVVRQLRSQVFGFIGVKPLKTNHFSAASQPEPETVAQWTKQVAALGAAGR